MELRVLRYFLAVAREQNITRAAETLFLAQPSLSRQMQLLEREVGQPLFVRGKRTITLTEAGKLLKKRAEEILDLYEKTQTDLMATANDVEGEIYIGGGESHAFQTIAEAATALQRDYPGIRFRFFSGDAETIVERLDKGLIDFGVTVDLADLTRYESIRLPLTDRWGVLMPADSPLARQDCLTPNDLKGLPLICSRQSLRPGSRLLQWFGDDIRRIDVRATYNLLYNASLLVKAGLGYAVGLDRLINTKDTALCFRPLSPTLTTHLDLVWKQQGALSRPATLFLTYLKQKKDLTDPSSDQNDSAID